MALLAESEEVDFSPPEEAESDEDLLSEVDFESWLEDDELVEAPESVEEMTVIGRRFDVPLLANPLEGGRSPILTPKEYGELGFGIIGYGITLVLRAATAIQTAIEDTRSGRFGTPQNAMGLEQFKDIVGFADWARIEDKYRPR